ncbi:hypothetical protein C943_00214 [Mariniradius saccharolyticus AK6]|uniref:Uncharacterized protein n=1 Tax=Mariniradius saccharolyticus AK6 TaxID=1239962 RepID=M7YE88_9BACT|nr:hypothetical protein C943_00214 [Mariniradius saccharolyticus AK6]
MGKSALHQDSKSFNTNNPAQLSHTGILLTFWKYLVDFLRFENSKGYFYRHSI